MQFNIFQPALAKVLTQTKTRNDAVFLSAVKTFVTRATQLRQKCNPSDAAVGATTIVTSDEYFIKLHHGH